MRRFLLGLACFLAACSTELEPDEPGNRISGVLRYDPSQSALSSFARPGVVVFVEPFVADPTTGQPSTTLAATPTVAWEHLFYGTQEDEIRGDGLAYNFRSIPLGKDAAGHEVDAWPFVVIAAVVDYSVFKAADASAYFQTSPFGGYPTVCSLSPPPMAIPESAYPLIHGALAQYGADSPEAFQGVVAAVNARLPSLIVPVWQALGSVAVIVSTQAPTPDINIAIYDNAQDPTNMAVPCKQQLFAVIQTAITASITSLLTTGVP